jgi:hypothetical protein
VSGVDDHGIELARTLPIRRGTAAENDSDQQNCARIGKLAKIESPATIS